MTTYQNQPQTRIPFDIPFNPTLASGSNPPKFAQITSLRPKLRSCLSPSRSPSDTPHIASALPTPSGSRSTSFSSCASGEGWKQAKCVRWQEMNGCAVTSTHDTYSHEEYDRTPLEPPSIAERECVLPARGTRCLSLSRDCFLSDSDSYCDEEDLIEDQDTTVDSYFLNTPPPTETCSEDGEAETEEEAEEKRQWEECMERRRQMFARMCPRSNGSPGGGGEEEERHPEFEGYKSISATLANLLRSVHENDNESDNLGEELLEGDEEDEEGGIIRGDCGFGYSSLKLNSIQDDEDEDRELEIDTPSLISSNGEELDEDSIISSPGGMNSNSNSNTSTTIIPNQNHNLHSQHHHHQQNHLGSCTEEIVLAAWKSKKLNNNDNLERGRDRIARGI